MNGRPNAAATSATLKLSMSTATAPVSRNAKALPATEPIGALRVSNDPLTSGSGAAVATRSRSRQSAEVAIRAPVPEMISVGQTTVPALKLGSRPPANPKLSKPATPASTRRRAAPAAKLAAHAADGEQRAIAERRQSIPPPHRLAQGARFRRERRDDAHSIQLLRPRRVNVR